MELLRRALLVGCILPGLWLLRLTPLDPLLSVVAVDFAALQKQEAASIPDAVKTEAQRRRALIALPVYVEELLQYNVFSATGPEWDRLLRGIDDLGTSGNLFFRPDEDPIRQVLDKLAAGGGTTYISMSRPGGDRHYRVDRRTWTREDFQPGSGFTGKPAPPVSLLYPFRMLGAGLLLAGVGLFALLPGSRRSESLLGLSFFEASVFASAILLFFVPLVIVGGSAQALTRGPLLTFPCWILAAVGVHLFAGPGRNAPDPLVAASAGRLPVTALFVREGLAFLAMALGPLAFLILASMILWNR